MLPLELVDPRFYHLDTCFLPAGAWPRHLLSRQPSTDTGSRSCAIGFPNLIEVAAEEAISFSCNAVVVGRTVILNEGAPQLAANLEAERLEVRPLAFSEFIKSGGSAKCLTFRIDGEEAASWKHDGQVAADDRTS